MLEGGRGSPSGEGTNSKLEFGIQCMGNDGEWKSGRRLAKSGFILAAAKIYILGSLPVRMARTWGNVKSMYGNTVAWFGEKSQLSAGRKRNKGEQELSSQM